MVYPRLLTGSLSVLVKNVLFWHVRIPRSSQDAERFQNSKSLAKEQLIFLTCFLRGYTSMFTNSYIQVFNTFTIIGLAPQSTLKPINDTRSNIFENAIFEMKVVT